MGSSQRSQPKGPGVTSRGFFFPYSKHFSLQSAREFQRSGRRRLSKNSLPDPGPPSTWGDQELRNRLWYITACPLLGGRASVQETESHRPDCNTLSGHPRDGEGALRTDGVAFTFAAEEQ